MSLFGLFAIAYAFTLYPLHTFLARSTSHLPTATSVAEIDLILKEAAVTALREREGAIIVMDPQTGRLRTVLNSTMAFENAYTPGSTIKPFVVLASLQSRVITKNTRMLCQEHYSSQDFSTACSHTRDLPALDPSGAIAYSCNYYFGRLGERLAESTLRSTLASFGFGQPTGTGLKQEAIGSLVPARHDSRNSLGESEGIQTTPIQLLTAYTALVNGGKLLKPELNSARQPVVRAMLKIDPADRELIIKGMYGAVSYGSAQRSQLSSLPLRVFGKTGTATQPKEFRTHGWFVGFVARDETATPENIDLAILVFLKRANGAQAAETARVLLRQYAKRERTPPGEKAAQQNNIYSPDSKFEDVVRVHLVSENVTRSLPLEDYVRAVVTAEGSTENEPEALKALAVSVRTYAVKNRGRHQADGFDFCSTTHCQRFVASRPEGRFQVSASAVEAVHATEGLVLLEDTGRVADSYFSASCGGMTANLQSLWGARPVPYLEGIKDDYCASGSHHAWKDVISEVELASALSSDFRTNVGKTVHKISVLERDATGRAELIEIEGNERRTISGWDFKIIVGRKLGWHLLKSSRFSVEHLRSAFVFRGTGFGHGLGLCQEGAHVMAARGATFKGILGKYFPGLDVGRETEATKGKARGDLLWNNRPAAVSPAHHPYIASKGSNVLSSEHFRLSFPRSLPGAAAERVLHILESSRSELINRLSSAGLNRQFPPVELHINETTGDFTARTGQPWWAAAATRGSQIELQPLELLRRRGILDTTLRHELAHVAIHLLAGDRAPRWLAEGLALLVAGEGPLVTRFADGKQLSTEKLELQLGRANSREELRTAYAGAYKMVSRLVRNEGEAAVWLRLAQFRRT